MHQRKERFDVKAKIERILHYVYYIKKVENIGINEINNIGEAYMVSYDYISKNCYGIYIDFRLISLIIYYS